MKDLNFLCQQFLIRAVREDIPDQQQGIHWSADDAFLQIRFQLEVQRYVFPKWRSKNSFEYLRVVKNGRIQTVRSYDELFLRQGIFLCRN
ncbi:hypothetical protein SDC9_149686 [bioreactor metagenome]|uniref:Uncharacterized protein n=1 Tax=bioreactor metagenome TaxID=1076179 RepID=A0A645EM82_9ZZZZ